MKLPSLLSYLSKTTAIKVLIKIGAMTRRKLIYSQSIDSFKPVRSNIIDKYLNDKLNRQTSLKSFQEEETPDHGRDVDNSTDINYWPKCDSSIWMRSCEEEVIVPIKGQITGEIPKWLKGTLLRNGPGSLKVGDYKFDHLFDSSALLHKFYIKNGEVTYQRRFVQTDVYKKNHRAKRIVLTEFGTRAAPDPCQTIFNRIAAIFNPADNASDNSMISVYPFDDEFYTFTEYPVIHRIDPETLETKSKVNISKYVGIVNHTSHPHVMEDGSVFNVGMSITSKGPAYSVVQFPCKKDDQRSMFEQAKIVATLPVRWMLNPSYMHTFGITDNFYIIVEQPLAVSLATMVKSHLNNDPLNSCLKWHENESTLIHVISRSNGKLLKSFIADTFFFLHIINQFETLDKNYVVIDICCYRDAKMLNCMYVDEMKNMHKNPDYSKLFRGRPLRFILPIGDIKDNISADENLIQINTVHQRTDIEIINHDNYEKNIKNTILEPKASAYRLKCGKIFVQPELICDLGCETPRFNYDRCLGKEYRYFYAISSDVDLDNPGTLIKVDTATKTKTTWKQDGLYPSEPIFVPRPGATDEDDGVILSAAIFGESNETDITLLIIDAKTMKEIGRSIFSTPGPVPKCLHGWFTLERSIS
ncbi:carotenoid isomerooxygenase [Chelonus insularis]|uniref:carotenoid isomerooxygenase n=1 Tax=Chelonus insularis TaxID=460826 RepID=UPI001589C2CF|nr:carotenoid isomerooxygenase [Chelonus insularis]